MKEQTYFKAIEKIYKKNKGFVTREEIDDQGIPSWFLSDFVKRKSLIKVAPGFYADVEFVIDEYYILQRRFPKYIISGMSALFIHHLTDKIVTNIEVTAPQGYNPTRSRVDKLIVHKISDKEKYLLGIEEKLSMFGNKIRVYDPERTICDIIKYRDNYDSETFVKAIKLYLKRYNNIFKLIKYSKTLGIEKKVFEIMELMTNVD